MSNKKHHAEWLSLLEISGPFVSLPVLEKVFPQGLDAHDADHARRMRLAFDEWETNQFGPKPNPAIHNAWVQFVLKETLTLPDEVLASGQSIPQTFRATHSEAGEIIRPDLMVRNPTGVPDAGKTRMVVQVYPADQHLEKHVHGLRWKASPADRMAELLKQTKCQVGLVTNGEHWILTNKSEELPTGFASFYSSLWLEEPITLRAFRNLLEARRFFGVLPGQTLEEMLVESATNQQEVTDQLGLQVRRAVEVLIQSLDRADQDDKVLAGVPETVLYEAALTVMMRLVFLFCAEERELLLLGDPLYDQHYAVSTLVAQLQETADNHGEEILERRLDAWSRLLSTFRAVYGGVQHERMKLPAYAGNLFDPDRFPFLEGRRPKTSWKDTPASPLPVNNRTVLHLLRSLQYLQIHGEAQRISFRALGIEQIGHVYEGLLDHTAKRATEPVLGLKGSKGLEPELPLSTLVEVQANSEDELVKFLKEETGRSESGIRSSLGVELEGEEAGKLRAACGNDKSLYDRVLPFANLIHNDSFDRPVVIRKGSVYVTSGTDRRSTGTHYTPTTLTEPIVKHTLTPLCYVCPAEGRPEDQWQLRSAKELLDLKICDMACGSGAFLVQACRFLSERLVEAWEQAAEKVGGKAAEDLRITPYGEPSTGAPDEQLIPTNSDERLVYARRLVAQRCLYGVDKNPLAVEMAKLSLWLLTLAKDKPFTFLDHCVRPGDSLIGIGKIEQLLRFSLSAGVSTGPLFLQQRKQIENRLNAVQILRKQIEETPSNTPQDIERKTAMLQNADEQTRRLTYAADMLLVASWETMDSPKSVEAALNSTLVDVEYKFKDLPIQELDSEAIAELSRCGLFKSEHGCVAECRLHWPIEFPEVFSLGGFHAIIGNPPWGQKAIDDISTLGTFVRLMFSSCAGIFDLFRPFVERAIEFIQPNGMIGLVLPDVLLLKDYPDTRRLLLDRTSLIEISWRGMAFAGATIDAITLITRKEVPTEQHRLNVHIHQASDDLRSTCIPQASFLKNPGFTFNLFLTDEKRQVLDALEQCPNLDSLFEFHEGVHSGNIRSELFVDSELDASCEPFYFGRNEIERHRLHWHGRYIRLSAVPKTRSKERYANIGQEHWHHREKVLVRRTGDYVLAAVDTRKHYASNNFFIVFPKLKYRVNLYGLCALLNSKFYTWFFRVIEPRKGRAFAELKIKHLRRFPLPSDSVSEQLIQQLNALGEARSKLENNSAQALDLDRQIDELVERVFQLPHNLIEKELPDGESK